MSRAFFGTRCKIATVSRIAGDVMKTDKAVYGAKLVALNFFSLQRNVEEAINYGMKLTTMIFILLSQKHTTM